MDRNTELHFSQLPTIDISRCKLTKGHDHKTTFSTGSLIPLYVDDILPGTTVKMRMSEVVRMMTPIAPVMDNAYMDIYWFFTPNRLLWSHWVNFMGENDTAPWAMPQNYEVPQITFPSGGWAKGSLGDYFGLPTGVANCKVSALPFRAYCKIWNDWFRDENNKNPVYITMGDSDTTGVNKGVGYDPVTDTECGAAPLKAAKLHDYFTSCLPAAQRGPAVEVPIGADAPVHFKAYAGTPGLAEGKNLAANPSSGTASTYAKISAVDDDGVSISNAFTDAASYYLFTDLSKATGATILQLRQAFQIQKFYERSARSGSRYIESILAHFSVQNPDYRLQRPEYLGGKRVPINMNSVVQTDASGKASWYDSDNSTWVTDDKTPQGNLAAYSATSDTNEDMFTRSFTEHGILMCLAVIRTDRTYQQGINRMWSRKSMFDFYWPELANLGEQAVLNKEIYAQGSSAINSNTGKPYDEEAFGYQEPWAEYRMMPSIVSGELRSNYAQSLDIWHYADDYSGLPALSSEWIDEPESNVARTLAVQSHDQFFGDFFFSPIYTLPMPLYSVPGLMDHH